MKRLAPSALAALFAFGLFYITAPADAGSPVPCATSKGYCYSKHGGMQCHGHGHRKGHGYPGAAAGKAHPYGPKRMDRIAYNQASGYSWHGNYKYTQWGVPVALVVPPTAEWHAEWGWGVSENRVYRLNHQFQREYPGETGVVVDGYGGGMFKPTPIWPSDTTQFGVYPVRGPWD